MAVRDASASAPRRLRFGSDEEPGIRRRGRSRVQYVDEKTGRQIGDPRTLARIRRLAVPPAWTDVWIASDQRSHLQATGRDARGRKQYRYHADFRRHREEAKFDLLVPFGETLPSLRRQLQLDLRRPGLPRERLLALVVSLLEETLVRVGNEEYTKANGSFGLTTLRDRHVTINGNVVHLTFMGKSGKRQRVEFRDPRLARLVRRCQDLPGQTLFQYVTETGERRRVRSSDVNDYLRAVTGLDVTAKTFRTWHGTLDAAVALAAEDPPASRAEARRVVSAVMKSVATELRNTAAVCRASYVHPAIVESYSGGDLRDRWAAASARGSRLLSVDERRLLHVLARLTDGRAKH